MERLQRFSTFFAFRPDAERWNGGVWSCDARDDSSLASAGSCLRISILFERKEK